ncbi:MAG: hypothetical protein LBU89_10150 [Fibromonadaceae bacterium]|nr:hypothetical protein [Fibromonadaceae bacterium]
MASEGSSGCAEEKTEPCDGTGEVLTFYRAYAPKTTAAALAELKKAFCRE